MEVDTVVTGGKVVVCNTVLGGSVRVVTEGGSVLYTMTGVVVVMKEVVVRITGGKVLVTVTSLAGRVVVGPGTSLVSVTLVTTGVVTVNSVVLVVVTAGIVTVCVDTCG